MTLVGCGSRAAYFVRQAKVILNPTNGSLTFDSANSNVQQYPADTLQLVQVLSSKWIYSPSPVSPTVTGSRVGHTPASILTRMWE